MLKQLALAALLAAGLATAGSAAEPNLEAMIAGAKQEGALIWYTGSERGPAEILLNAFQKKYPFIRAQMVRASSSELANRVEAALAANRLQADVFEFSLAYLTASLQDRNEIMQFDSAEYAAYPPEFSKNGYWAATGLVSIIIISTRMPSKLQTSPRAGPI
jgi:iron(III) transport system substrate-binding protein